MPENKIFPIVREKAPIVDRIRERMNPEENKSVSSKNELATVFREGLAEGLDIPPEALKIEEVESWIVNYLKAFVNPDLMTKAVPKLNEIRSLGKDLGIMIKSSLLVPENLPNSENISTENKREPLSKRTTKRTRDASVVSKQ